MIYNTLTLTFTLQCQMGKQTMGTPAHALKYRSDNKLYRIQNPQAPLVQTQMHAEYGMDEYPQVMTSFSHTIRCYTPSHYTL